jgi:hypothetical protein
MKIDVLSPRVRKVCAAGAVTLMLSVLAHAAPGGLPGSPEDNGLLPPGLAKKLDPPPVVPEANAGLVLIPVVAAILFFSTRRIWATKRSLAADGQQASGETQV